MDISKPGTAIVVYSDDGPSGPCGQGMETTCPHTAIHVFENEELMRSFCESHEWRNGKNWSVHAMVVGEFHSTGMSLTIHKQLDSAIPTV